MPSLKNIKEAVVASKKAAAAKTSKNTTKSSTLSTEYVGVSDSDVESDRSESSVEAVHSKPFTRTKRALTPPKRANVAPPPSKSKSSAPKASSPSSDSESANESKSESSSESGSEGDSGSSGSEESSSATSTTGKEKGLATEKLKSPPVNISRRKSAAEPPLAQAQSQYKPPNGFESIPIPSTPSSKALDIFSSSNLAGKQIWHITAPTSIPISTIKEVSLENVAKGEGTCTYEGIDYGFIADKDANQARKRVMMPSAEGNGYRSPSMNIAKTLHLQQMVHLPSLAYRQAQAPSGSQQSTVSSRPSRRPPRQQPKVLKMRFHPFGDHIEKPGQIGFESTSSSDGSSEVDEAEPEFRVPQGLEEVKRPKKRKQFEVNGMNGEQVQAAQSTPDGGGSRRKKAKHDASNGKQKLLTSRTPESAMDIDSPSATDVARDWDREPLESNQEHMERETKKKRKKEKLKDGKGRSKNRSTAEQRS